MPPSRKRNGNHNGRQYTPPVPRFDGYDRKVVVQQAMGDDRSGKRIFTVGELRSPNWKPGVSGFRITPDGIEFGDTSGTFPPGSISLGSIQDITTARLLGRTTAGTGPIEQLASSTVKTLLAIVSSDISDFTEAAQDAVGAMADSQSLVYTDATPLLAVKVQLSITKDGSGLKLVGDSATPGNNKFYGTDGSGTKGYQTFALSVVLAASSITPVADATYTVGARLTPGGTDGTITTVKGIITAVTQAT